MKIAVLSDIHGNHVALKAVIDHACKNGIEKFIFAGDLISDCPNPNEVLDTIKNLDGWVIKGNREELILKTIDDKAVDWESYRQMDSVIWTRNCLREDHVEYLRGLPEQVAISIEGCKKIRVVHGSTDSTSELLTVHKQNRVTEILSQIEEDVLICGHTHIPWSRRVNGKLIVNTGAVGVSFNSDIVAEYASLSWDGSNWRAEHHKVSYKLEILEGAFQSSGLYVFGGIWPQLILESLNSGSNRNVEFIDLVQKLEANEGVKSLEFFDNKVWMKACNLWNDRISQ